MKKDEIVRVDGVEVGKDIKDREESGGRPVTVKISLDIGEMLTSMVKAAVEEARKRVRRRKLPP